MQFIDNVNAAQPPYCSEISPLFGHSLLTAVIQWNLALLGLMPQTASLSPSLYQSMLIMAPLPMLRLTSAVLPIRYASA
jgi:hypothetical protein